MLNYDEFIFPNPEEKICIVKAENPNDFRGRKLSKGLKLYNIIMEELNHPFFKSMIKILQCSRNLSKNVYGPNVLYLSENEGCFPRTGLHIKEGESYEYFRELNYVDLVLDEERVLNGELYIYTHELAHTMLKNLLPNFPHGKSSIPHFSQCITDYFTAFDEGFAEQFERITCENVPKYLEIKRNNFNFERNFLKLWICNFDKDLRYEGVFKNNFIYKKIISKVDNLSIENSLLLEQVSPNFDTTKLKTGAEMLSCEGVVATIFYNICTDKILQNNYTYRHIYNKFLIKTLPDNADIKDVFSPYENVLIKVLWVMYNLTDRIKEDSPVLINFIENWCEYFPEDKERIINIFINITAGKTIENDVGRIYEQIAIKGMFGMAEAVSNLILQYRKHIKALCNKVVEGEVAIGKNIPKQLWVENKRVPAPKISFSDLNTPTMMINLNTASITQLMSFSKMTLEAANKILSDREDGRFIDENDIL